MGLCLVPLVPVPETHTPPTPITPQLFTTSLRDTIPTGATVLVRRCRPSATARPSSGRSTPASASESSVATCCTPPATAAIRPTGRTNKRSGCFSRSVCKRAGPRRPHHPTLLDRRRHRARAAADVSMVIVGYSRYGRVRQLDIAEQLLARPPDAEVGGPWNGACVRITR